MRGSNLSYVTILRPRELHRKTSSRMPTDFLLELESGIDRNEWRNRTEFFLQTLAFCLSLQNILRFPKEALLEGQAAFVWLYIIFMVIIGSCLLFFEVSLGQCSTKGFAKVFAMCPLFEGISYAMGFYCVVVSTYYNMLNAYAFVYLFASVNATLSYATCGDFPHYLCVEGSSNQTLTPEHVFFNHRIQYYSTDTYNERDTFSKPNWRNIGVLFFLWALVCLSILRGIRTVKWPAYVYCPIPYVVLIFTLIMATTLKGSTMGLKAMFLINASDLLKLQVWRKAFEQMIVSLGLGMGPLITLGSYSQFKADKDCILLCMFAMIGSLLSGAVMFSTVGILAHERNQTMGTVLKENGKYPEDFSAYMVFSQLFARLAPIVSNSVSFVFYFTFILAGWFSLIIYTETFIVLCYAIFPFSFKHNIFTNMGLCIVCFTFGSSLATRAGFAVLVALDKYLVAIGLVVIIFCELCAVIYIYGGREFCDDIDSISGFYPNYFFQGVWIFTPFLLLLLFCELLYSFSTETLTAYDPLSLALTGLVIVPIIVVGVLNMYRCHKTGHIKQVLAPRDALFKDDSTHARRSSFKWTQRSSTRSFVTTDIAGPSHVAQTNLRK